MLEIQTEGTRYFPTSLESILWGKEMVDVYLLERTPKRKFLSLSTVSVFPTGVGRGHTRGVHRLQWGHRIRVGTGIGRFGGG